MSVKFSLYLINVLIAAAFVCSLPKVSRAPICLKFLSCFLGSTLITECVALYFNYARHNNLVIYLLMGPVNMTFSSLYFNYIIPQFKKWHVGYIGAGIGLLFTLWQIVFVEGGWHRLNTVFAQWECLCNVWYCFYFFYALVRSEGLLRYQRNPHFWFALLFLFFYLCTFLSWGMINTIDKSSVYIVYRIVYYLNLVFYVGISLVYIVLRPNSYSNTSFGTVANHNITGS